jgi:hypothetical protein
MIGELTLPQVIFLRGGGKLHDPHRRRFRTASEAYAWARTAAARDPQPPPTGAPS